jgi:hypothetical protein
MIEKETYSSSTHRNRQKFLVKQISSREAAFDAAERRWHKDLSDQFVANANVYGEVIEKIDADLQKAATEAEMRKHGAGIRFILSKLRLQSVGNGGG